MGRLLGTIRHRGRTFVPGMEPELFPLLTVQHRTYLIDMGLLDGEPEEAPAEPEPMPATRAELMQIREEVYRLLARVENLITGVPYIPGAPPPVGATAGGFGPALGGDVDGNAGFTETPAPKEPAEPTDMGATTPAQIDAGANTVEAQAPDAAGDVTPTKKRGRPKKDAPTSGDAQTPPSPGTAQSGPEEGGGGAAEAPLDTAAPEPDSAPEPDMTTAPAESAGADEPDDLAP